MKWRSDPTTETLWEVVGLVLGIIIILAIISATSGGA